MSLRAGLGVVEKGKYPCRYQELNPHHSVCSLVTILTELHLQKLMLES